MERFKRVLASGLAIAIPLAVMIYVFVKFVVILERILSPVSNKLGIDHILGEVTLTFFATVALLIIILLLGLLMQLSFMHAFRSSVEDTALWLFPSIARIKTMTADRLSHEYATNSWKPIVAYVEGKFSPAFIVDESPNILTLNVMLTNSPSGGELLIVNRADIQYVEIPADQMMRCLRNFGKGFNTIIEHSGLIPS